MLKHSPSKVRSICVMSPFSESSGVPQASPDLDGRHFHNALCDKMRLMVKWIEMPVTAKIGGFNVTNL